MVAVIILRRARGYRCFPLNGEPFFRPSLVDRVRARFEPRFAGSTRLSADDALPAPTCSQGPAMTGCHPESMPPANPASFLQVGKEDAPGAQPDLHYEIRRLQRTQALLIAVQFAANHEAEFDVSEAIAAIVMLVEF